MNGDGAILAIIAFFGTIASPLLAYLASTKQPKGQVLLTDIEAISKWREERTAFENRIQELYDLIESNRVRHRTSMDTLEQALEDCESKLSHDSISKKGGADK